MRSMTVALADLISSEESANRIAGVMFRALHSLSRVVSVGVLFPVSIYVIIF